MSVRVQAIASGSNGNCFLVESDTDAVIIDAGISRKRIVDGLKRINVPLSKVRGIFITHAHQAFDCPDTLVSVPAINHQILVLLELFDPVADLRERHMGCAGYMPLLVFLVGPDVEKHHALLLVQFFRRDLFDPQPAQDAKQLEDHIKSDDR